MSERIIQRLILGSSLLALLFSLNSGPSVHVSASTSPEYLLGNVSLGNLTAAQVQEITDKVVNYTTSLKERGNGNLTKMNLLVWDDMVKRNIINEKEKQELGSFISGLNDIKDTSNLTLINREVSSRLEALANNSSNPTMVTLKSALKHLTPSCEVGGAVPNTGVCIVMSDTATGIPNDNLTLGNTGLPPMTIEDDQAIRFGHCLMWVGAGAVTYDGIGGAIGLGACIAQ